MHTKGDENTKSDVDSDILIKKSRVQERYAYLHDVDTIPTKICWVINQEGEYGGRYAIRLEQRCSSIENEDMSRWSGNYEASFLK